MSVSGSIWYTYLVLFPCQKVLNYSKAVSEIWMGLSLKRSLSIRNSYGNIIVIVHVGNLDLRLQKSEVKPLSS